MSKLAKLRKGFASGMSEARISDDQWNDEFVPMIEDAERLAFLIKYGMGTWVDIPTDQPDVTHRITLYTREEIDAARQPEETP